VTADHEKSKYTADLEMLDIILGQSAASTQS
jgi:hypothetical protein